jgi:hypothetical protein
LANLLWKTLKEMKSLLVTPLASDDEFKNTFSKVQDNGSAFLKKINK